MRRAAPSPARTVAAGALVAAALVAVSLAVSAITLPSEPPPVEHLPAGTPEPVRCEPADIAVSNDGSRLLVVCPGAGTLLVLDAATGVRLAELATGDEPVAVAVHPSAPRAYVADHRGGEVFEIDLATRRVTRRLPAGVSPRGLATDRAGRTLYVANIRSNDVSVIDLASGRQLRRFLAGHGPHSVARSSRDGSVFVTSLYELPAPWQSPPSSELTVIDGDGRRLATRHRLAGAVMGRGVAVSPDGELTVVAIVRPRNLVPMTQVAGGWMMTNGLAVLDNTSGRVDQVLLDQPNGFFSDPHGVLFSPDGRYLYASSLGTHTIAVVDVARLRAVLAGADEERRALLGDDRGASRDYVVARFSAGDSPAALALSPDGKRLYVANRFPDTVTVVDTTTLSVIATAPLGYAALEGHRQWGRRIFHDARYAFQMALACASCHPEDHYDGLVYDLEPDGLGRDLVDNRSLRGVGGTEPFKWNGKNVSLSMQAGPRAANFFLRSTGFRPEELAAVVDYISHVPPMPNPHRPAGAPLTPAQERGRLLYEREVDGRGRPIPPESRCVYCHPGPSGTNHKSFNVGTRAPHDHAADFDTPHLINVADSAPYLHDGRCFSLEEIWTLYNDGDRHGVTSDMNKQQLNDLIEYLKTF